MGAGWSPTDDLTIDLAYSYLREESVKVNGDDHGQTYNAKYDNYANGFGLGATYRF
ncbi:Outer membrane protein transport protein (OMPP1/FadL/TodX) [compost metagenome]